MNGLFEGSQGVWLRRAIIASVALLALFLAVQVIAGVKEWRYIGAGLSATNTITVSGHGEALAVPDIATFSFSVVSDKATVAAAQEDATAKINAITAYLKDAGIDEKDIQTSDYSVYPQYEYQNAVCPTVAPTYSGASASAIYCPSGKQVLKGYEVRQTTAIKVRDTEKAGDLLSGVGTKGATEVSGLTFTFDKPDMVQDEARDKAIQNAKEKADTLAKSLGVHLVRVVSYNENGNYSPMYARDVAYGSAGLANETKAAAPEISIGQNKVTSDVAVTYEIR
ncbi:MAG TPA: SIMPL domain-containing protein [Candidatus Paceibacterota bacterium]|nr:SIMPL domain-containing protein [Candidatus Paceibacterota bacterium]